MMALRRFLKDDNGTATLEFLFVFPIIFLILTASLESSFYMVRYVMLERSVDMVMRELRLGIVTGMTYRDLKRRICDRSTLVASIDTCVDSLRIWMQPISTTTFALPATPDGCVDRDEEINPALDTRTATEFAYGGSNEIMLLRICLKERPMFPTTVVGANLIADEGDGHYGMIVTSAYVNEPTN